MLELMRAAQARCVLLGLEAEPLLRLVLDAVLLLVGTAALATRLAGAGGSRPRRLLAVGLVGLAAVVLPATALGAAGWLTNRNLVLVHAGLAAAAVAAAPAAGLAAKLRHAVRAALNAVRDAGSPLGELLSTDGWRRERRAESALLVAIVAVLGFYALLALFTLPLNYDANTYRLTRVAFWLQDASIYHFDANDPRVNWIGQNVELVMLWLVSFFRHGYPLVQLVQWVGGGLACLAVHALGAQLGLARFWRLAGVAVMLGTPTVATQFFTAQTDLFVAGCLAAGLVFLRSALAGGRLGDWLLAGAGGGLAVGTKVTVFYWGAGLALLLLGWLWLERGTPRSSWRGAAAAAVAVMALSGFNLVLNLWEYDHGLGPRSTRRWATQVDDEEPFGRTATNALVLVWQTFEPHSNPFVPDVLHAPAFARLLPHLAVRDSTFRKLAAALPAQGGWQARGLNEDEASFGLPATLLALAGGVAALLAAARRRERREAALLALAVVGFLLVYCSLQDFDVNRFRYLCMVAPFTALLGVDLLARGRGRLAAPLAALVLLVQLATAAAVGVASRNQGLAALRDPSASRWYPLWAAGRRQAEALGDRPLVVGIAVLGNSWQAPLLRSPVPHRWRSFRSRSLADRPTLREWLDAHRLDALVADPAALRHLVLDGTTLRFAAPAGVPQRTIVERAAAGEMGGPRVVEAEGVAADGWTDPRSAFWLDRWTSGRFELEVSNPTPLTRTVELRSDRDVVAATLSPGARQRLTVAVAPRDVAVLVVTPDYLLPPSGAATDGRPLGVRLDPPSITAAEGVFADGWTASRGKLLVVNWLSGRLVSEASNPTTLHLALRARSAVGERRWELPPGSSVHVDLPVLMQDTVELEVELLLANAPSDGGNGRAGIGVRLRPQASP